MNNLFNHIEYLLLCHDCVIVPGLGAFIAIINPAKFDFEKRLVLPPSRSVMFNHAVSSDDGLLANSYVRKYNITFEEARQIIMKETSLLKEKLNSDKKIIVGNLGKLQIGEEGNMVFTPATDISTFNSVLGFETLHISGASCENNSDMSESDMSKSVHNFRFRISKTYSRIAAVFIVLVALTITMILNPIPSDNREQRASVVPVDAIMISNAVDKTTDLDNGKNEIDPITPAPTEISSNHYLIVATFKSNQEALTYIAIHSSDEFPMQTVESKKVTRVAIAASDNKEILRKQLNSKEIADKFPNAWIWSRN